MTRDEQSTYEEDQVKQQENQPGPPPSTEMVQANFAACSRCSYFLSAYKILGGVPGIDAAVEQSSKEWLTLAWNEEVRQLLQRSYGCRIDLDFYHFESCCPDCCRHYVVDLGVGEGAQPEFQLQIVQS